MIYRCNKCEKEYRLMKGANYCPYCGEKIEPIKLNERVVDLHKIGKTVKEIADELQVRINLVDRMVVNALLAGEIDPATIIQSEYEAQIMKVMSGEWDGKLKTIKEALPEDCSYTTIGYYAEMKRRSDFQERKKSRQEARKKAIEERNAEIRILLKSGMAITQIAETVHTSNMNVEKVLVEEIAKDKAIANPYINNDYKAKILEIVESPEWDGKLKSVKEQLPEEVTYTNIKATIAKFTK